jgi:hypothetical protein
MALGLVRLVKSIPKLILLAEPETKFGEPLVIGIALTNPDRTRVIRVGLLVCPLRKKADIACYMMGRIKELCCLKNHLDDMLVAMQFGRNARDEAESKDVHL